MDPTDLTIARGFVLANDTLLQQLLWVLVGRGDLPAEEVVGMCARAASVNTQAGGPANKVAAAHLEQIRLNFERKTGWRPS